MKKLVCFRLLFLQKKKGNKNQAKNKKPKKWFSLLNKCVYATVAATVAEFNEVRGSNLLGCLFFPLFPPSLFGSRPVVVHGL